MRQLSVVVVGGLLVLVSCTGCSDRLFQAMADATPGQGERSVSYNAEQAMSEGDGQQAVHEQTMANIDKILEDHPNAINHAKLVELRRQLGGEGNGDGSATPQESDTNIERFSSLTVGDELPEDAFANDPFDRRQINWTDDRRGPMSISGDIGEISFDGSIENNLAVSRSETRTSPLGRRAEVDFQSIPRQTSMSAPQQPIAIHKLSGVEDAFATTDPNAIPYEP